MRNMTDMFIYRYLNLLYYTSKQPNFLHVLAPTVAICREVFLKDLFIYCVNIYTAYQHATLNKTIINILYFNIDFNFI